MAATFGSALLPSDPNRILSLLPLPELSELRPHLVRVRLVRGQVLIEAGQSTEHVFFLDEGIATLMVQADGQRSGVHVGMIGREGMVGALALLEDGTPATAGVMMQVPGTAWRIPVAQLRRSLDTCPTLRVAAWRFVQSLARQVMRVAASNATYTIIERCACWLLMAHERLGEDDLPVTHEELAAMLGVRRAGVTLATAALQDMGLIRSFRGRVRVTDRDGLQALLGGPAARRGESDGAADLTRDGAREGAAATRAAYAPTPSPSATIPLPSVRVTAMMPPPNASAGRIR